MDIIKAEDLPLKERVYLKKDFMGWRVVEPYKNEDGTINWFNFVLGGKRGIVWLTIILLITGMLYLGINQLISNYKVIANEPCKYCADYVSQFGSENIINISLFTG